MTTSGGTTQVPPQVAPPKVIFFTDNGLGLGHMTRLLAVARHSAGRFQPVAMTLSLAYPLLRGEGVPAEHFPSYSHVGMTKRDWSPLLADRILETVAWTGASVVVVDHVSPPGAFRSLRAKAPDLHLIWSRRGLWRKGKNAGALRESTAFHTVVEPGDVAAAIDIGITAAERESVVKVEPIVLVGPDDFVSRSEARRHLGLPDTGRAFLLQLGEETPQALRTAIELTRDSIREAVGSEPVHLFAPLHPLHAGSIEEIEGVIMRPEYPVARFMRAFDGAVSMAGYNSLHEIVVSGIPAVFMARNSKIDDQHRRARFTGWSGRAFYADKFTGADFRQAVAKMVRAEESAIAAATSEALGPMNGAREFADVIARHVIQGAPGSPPVAGPPALSIDVSSFLEGAAAVPSGTLVVSVARLSQAEAEVVHRRLESSTQDFVLLIGPEHEFRRVPFESMMGPSAWATVNRQTPYEQYLMSRISRMGSRYSAAAAIDLRPGMKGVHRRDP